MADRDPAEQLVSDLRNRGVELWLQDQSLRYRAPEGALDRVRLEALRTHKGDIIEILRRGEAAPASLATLHDEERTGAPLSFAQESFVSYYHKLSDPSVQHLYFCLRLTGALDTDTLRMALTFLPLRHPVLRTRYDLDRQRPYSVVDDALEIGLDTIDLRQVGPASREAQAQALFDECFSAWFNLEKGPLIRARLINIEPHRQHLVVVIHHSICDAASISILRTDLVSYYLQAAGGNRRAPAPTTISYADHARWLRDWVDSPAGSSQLSYWKRRFSGATQPFWLPTGTTDSCTDAAKAEPDNSARISADLTTALRVLGQKYQTSLFVVILTAFAVTLLRWALRRHVFVTVIHNGRQRPELQDVVGCLLEAWVLRVDFHESDNLLDALRRVKEAYLDALPNLQLPYWKMKEELARLADNLPLLDITFNYVPRLEVAAHSGQGERTEKLPVTAEYIYLQQNVRPLDDSTGSRLFVTLIEGERDTLEWSIHSTTQFNPPTIQSVSSTLSWLLRQLATNPTASCTGPLVDGSFGRQAIDPPSGADVLE